MSKALSSSLLAGVLAIAAAVSQSASCPGTLTAAAAVAEKKAILQVISAMQDAWNRGDFRGYM